MLTWFKIKQLTCKLPLSQRRNYKGNYKINLPGQLHPEHQDDFSDTSEGEELLMDDKIPIKLDIDVAVHP